MGAWENRGGERGMGGREERAGGVLKGWKAGEIGRDLNSTMLDI